VLSFGAEITGCPFVAKQIHVSPWRFDDARNTALSLVWPEIDMCISLDIDEYMSENFVDELKALKRRVPQINRVNHRFSTIWDAANSTDHWHERIHSRAGYRWVLPVHEKLETHDQEFTEWLAHIRMYQKPDLTKSRSSYRPLLEQSVKERPNIWKSWSFLAGEYAGAGEYDKALDAINSALSIADSDKAYLQTQLGYFNEHLGKYQEAENNFINATFYAPLVREYKVKVADYLERRGQQALANVYLVQASQITTRTYGYEFDPACWTDEFNHRVEKAKSSQQ
jgi:tetratricopeptide (TPR) repeat protein